MKNFDKLKAKLAELFQVDQADLDFGIYRIMNARRDKINRFLERDLLPQVREDFWISHRNHSPTQICDMRIYVASIPNHLKLLEYL